MNIIMLLKDCYGNIMDCTLTNKNKYVTTRQIHISDDKFHLTIAHSMKVQEVI